MNGRARAVEKESSYGTYSEQAVGFINIDLGRSQTF